MKTENNEIKAWQAAEDRMMAEGQRRNAKAQAELLARHAARAAAKNAAGLANQFGAAVHRLDAEDEIGAAAVRAMVDAGHAVHEPTTGRILILMG